MSQELEKLARLGVVLKLTFTTTRGDTFTGEADEVFAAPDGSGILIAGRGLYARPDAGPGGWPDKLYHRLCGTLAGLQVVDCGDGAMSMSGIRSATIEATEERLPATRDRAGARRAALKYFGLADA